MSKVRIPQVPKKKLEQGLPKGHYPAGPYGGYPYPEPPSEPVALEPGACEIVILTSAKERSFNPPDDKSAKVKLTAELRPKRAVRDGETVLWSLIGGENDGTVKFSSPDTLTSEILARKPNKTRVRVQLFDAGGNEICKAETDLSVPQFFFVFAVQPRDDPDEEEPEGATFLDALIDLGLQISLDPLNDTLEASMAKVELNTQIQDKVVSRAIEVAKNAFKGVNVRFVTKDPKDLVGKDNYSFVALSGLSPKRDRQGDAPTDVGNKNPKDLIRVFGGEFSDMRAVAGPDPNYGKIFIGFARTFRIPGETMQAGGNGLQMGQLVTDPAKAQNRAQLIAYAAFEVVSRLIGHTIAHECGHSLGLVPGADEGHNPKPLGTIMDAGKVQSLKARTGLSRFDVATKRAAFGSPAGFDKNNLQILQKVLPILSS